MTQGQPPYDLIIWNDMQGLPGGAHAAGQLAAALEAALRTLMRRQALAAELLAAGAAAAEREAAAAAALRRMRQCARAQLSSCCPHVCLCASNCVVTHT